jgi:hypothetical protein
MRPQRTLQYWRGRLESTFGRTIKGALQTSQLASTRLYAGCAGPVRARRVLSRQAFEQ